MLTWVSGFNYYDCLASCFISANNYVCTSSKLSLFITLIPPTVAPFCSDILPTISNGGITYAGGSTDNRPVGATATYNCNGPYTLVGVSVRTCGSDGEWSSTPAPVCLSKDWLSVIMCTLSVYLFP